MNPIASPPEAAIRDIPLCRLALAPENVRKTPPDAAAEVQLQASIAAHGLLKNLVARPDAPDADGVERFAVVAGGRRLAALKKLAENGTLHADHPVPCKIAANGNAAGALDRGERQLPPHAPGRPGGRLLRRSSGPAPPSPPSPRASA